MTLSLSRRRRGDRPARPKEPHAPPDPGHPRARDRRTRPLRVCRDRTQRPTARRRPGRHQRCDRLESGRQDGPRPDRHRWQGGGRASDRRGHRIGRPDGDHGLGRYRQGELGSAGDVLGPGLPEPVRRADRGRWQGVPEDDDHRPQIPTARPGHEPACGPDQHERHAQVARRVPAEARRGSCQGRGRGVRLQAVLHGVGRSRSEPSSRPSAPRQKGSR